MAILILCDGNLLQRGNGNIGCSEDWIQIDVDPANLTFSNQLQSFTDALNNALAFDLELFMILTTLSSVTFITAFVFGEIIKRLLHL